MRSLHSTRVQWQGRWHNCKRERIQLQTAASLRHQPPQALLLYWRLLTGTSKKHLECHNNIRTNMSTQMQECNCVKDVGVLLMHYNEYRYWTHLQSSPKNRAQCSRLHRVIKLAIPARYTFLQTPHQGAVQASYQCFYSHPPLFHSVLEAYLSMFAVSCASNCSPFSVTRVWSWSGSM